MLLFKYYLHCGVVWCCFSAVGAAVLNDQLYVCGGYDGVASLNTVECYHSDTNKWVMVASMTKHRSAAGVVAFDGHVYAIGGHDGLSIFDSVNIINLEFILFLLYIYFCIYFFYVREPYYFCIFQFWFKLLLVMILLIISLFIDISLHHECVAKFFIYILYYFIALRHSVALFIQNVYIEFHN